MRQTKPYSRHFALRFIAFSALLVFWLWPANASAQVGQCAPDWPLSFCDAEELDAADNNLNTYFAETMADMATQLSSATMMQTGMVGQFFDADQVNDVRLKRQKFQSGAMKDYHPSEQLCRVGSYVRSIASSEAQTYVTRGALNKILSDYYLATEGGVSAINAQREMDSRIDKFTSTYCDPSVGSDENHPLRRLCQADNASRINKDINVDATLLAPLTLALNFRDSEPSGDEEDVIALAKNLYWPEILPLSKNSSNEAIYRARQLVAKTTVAHNSFTALAGMKAAPELPEKNGPAHMKAMLRELGLDDIQINQYLGDNPSYYAQMEVLSRVIYENPNFYTNLYDKPVNVDRINVALEAIQLMQMRDRFDSQLRREMLVSQLLEDALVEATSADLSR